MTKMNFTKKSVTVITLSILLVALTACGDASFQGIEKINQSVSGQEVNSGLSDNLIFQNPPTHLARGGEVLNNGRNTQIVVESVIGDHLLTQSHRQGDIQVDTGYVSQQTAFRLLYIK